MKKLAKVFAAALVFGTAASTAMAEDFYGAFDLGRADVKDACAGGPAYGCQNSATIFRIAGGYQFAPVLGVEASYGEYGTANNVTAAGNWQLRGFQVSAVGTFPLGHDFSLTGKVGVARTELKDTATTRSVNSTNLAFGVGALYDFNKTMAVRAQYEDLGTVGDANITNRTSKIMLLTVGGLIRF